jgi:hypothetical protein
LQDYLVLLSRNCVKTIYDCLSPFQNVVYRIGTAFTDQLDFIDQDKTFLAKTWLRLCVEHENESYDHRCNIVSPGAINQIKTISLFIPEKLQADFHQSLSDILNIALVRADLLQKIKILRHWHPNSNGHKLWCEYVRQSIEP